MYTIGFIGAGNMASAIIRGVLAAEILTPQDMVVTDLDAAKTDTLKQMGLNVASDARRVVSECRYVVLAVKPQVMRRFCRT
jgi:pyrroline-5-carboxylate reductase